MFRQKKPTEIQPVDPSTGGLEDALVIVDQTVNPYLVMVHEPTGFRAEQMRSLRNKLIAMNPDGAPKTLVVASAIAGEGKSICAVNLAIAFAELDRARILLVDADLRDPSVERYLHLNEGPGLSDLLLGRIGIDRVIRPSGVRNLSVLGAGSKLASPSEVLSSQRIQELYSRLKEQYQYVILDTPAVLPATDASVLAARADGTLLVVRLELSTRQLARQAVRALQDLGANVLGTFVTQVRGLDPEADPRFAYGSDQS